MPARLVAGVVALAATAAVPVVATSAHADPGPAAVVYLSDADNGLGLFGILAAPATDLAHPHPVLPTGSMVDVLSAKLSPDGQQLAALVDPTAGSDTDQGNYDLQVMNLDGSGRHSIVRTQSTDTTMTEINGFGWAGDGDIVYGLTTTVLDPNTFAQTTSRNLREVHVATGSSSVLPNTADLSDPAVAADGSSVAATYLDPNAPRGEVGLRTYDLATGTLSSTSLDAGFLGEPAWSPDGTKIAYVKDTSTNAAFRSAIEVVTNSAGAWSAPADLVATDASTFDENPSWAPDGSTLWLDRVDTASAAPKQSLWTVAADGTALQQVLSTSADVADPTVGPADTTAPDAPTLTPATLAGTTTTVAWTVPATDTDYLYAVITRTGPDGQQQFTASGRSYTDRSTVVGQTYTYAVAAVDAAGNSSAASAPRQVTALALPHVSVATPTSTSSATTSFPVGWAGAGNPAGTHYDVRQLTLPATVPAVVTTAATAATVKGAPGATYGFSARAVDAFGNATAFTPYVFAAVPYDQTAGSFGKGWTTLRSGSLWLGSEASTSTNGATVVFTVTSKAVQVIGDRLPGGASFRVYVGSSYRGTVSTAAKVTAHRQVLWSTALGTTARRTIKLVAVVAKGRTLRIDGLAAAR